MNNKFIIGILVLIALGTIGLMASGSFSKRDANVKPANNGLIASLYKSPSCGCCGQYASYLEKKGYGLEIENIQDMSQIKEEYGVPYELESCHTTEIDGYVVEGHIPEVAINKLLTERPDIKGIGMAGMPSGSPGMPGPKNSDFVIYEITHEGTKGGVFVTI